MIVNFYETRCDKRPSELSLQVIVGRSRPQHQSFMLHPSLDNSAKKKKKRKDNFVLKRLLGDENVGTGEARLWKQF